MAPAGFVIEGKCVLLFGSEVAQVLTPSVLGPSDLVGLDRDIDSEDRFSVPERCSDGGRQSLL